MAGLELLGQRFSLHTSGPFHLIYFENSQVALNLISSGTAKLPEIYIELQDRYKHEGKHLFHLWEDIWNSRRAQVIGRLRSVLGLNTRVHGRQTSVSRISQTEADTFLNANHLMGTAKAKHRFALKKDGEILAVACFSHLRNIDRNGVRYRSAELIRLATLSGYTVTGGFGKLLKYFIEAFRPDDVMSYADRDWSQGLAYERAGFQLVETTSPAVLWLDKDTLERIFDHRLPPDSRKESYMKLFNTGNLKYILYLRSDNGYKG
ncbi:hypothetical protein [Pedobacter deserti]|uniref:hypothetical protein n=1 Tax=Pedobacter deserti TaxID=2817382 RepID=UPI00210C8888|nr:hypothetical protein [Pedobacter sp. SYSU D00382]